MRFMKGRIITAPVALFLFFAFDTGWQAAEPLRGDIQGRIEFAGKILERDDCGQLDNGLIAEMVFEARHQAVIHFVFGDGGGVGQGCLDTLIEQRRARRWRIFSRLLTVILVLAVLGLLSTDAERYLPQTTRPVQGLLFGNK